MLPERKNVEKVEKLICSRENKEKYVIHIRSLKQALNRGLKLKKLFTVYRSQKRFKSYNHDVYTEEVNKIALSNNDDKRIQTFDGTETYPYGTNAVNVCECEMLVIKDLFFKMVLQQQ